MLQKKQACVFMASSPSHLEKTPANPSRYVIKCAPANSHQKYDDDDDFVM